MVANADFYTLAPGLEQIVPVYEDGANAQALVPLTVQAPTFDGVAPGELTAHTWRVHMAQLELAPRDYLIYPNFPYDAEVESSASRSIRASLEQLGDRLPPLHVLPTGRVVIFQGERLPVFAVYDDPVQFDVMKRMRRSFSDIIIEQDAAVDLLIRALQRVRNTIPMSSLDECDVAARLDAEGVRQEEIAAIMAVERHTGERLSQGTISKMIAASRLPQPVRDFLNTESINKSHAYLLAGRLRGNDDAAIAMATWVTQAKRTVDDLLDALNKCYPSAGAPRGHLVKHANGSYELVITRSEEQQPPPPPALRFAAMSAIRDDEIRRTAQNTHRAVKVRVEDGEVVVDPTSFKGYAAFIQQAQDHAVTLHDAEVMAFGFLAALRQACQAQNVLTRQGKLAPVTPKSEIIP